MTALEKVTVILPTYNRRGMVGDAIESVLCQSQKKFELIVVDDGSTDDTDIIVQRFNDRRLKYIKCHHIGRSAARNIGLNIAKGEYIAFIDSDDLYLPQKLQVQTDFLDEHPEYGMIYTSAHCTDGVGNPMPNGYAADVSGWIHDQIAYFRPVTVTLPTVMVRKSAIDRAGRFDPQMDRFEDTDMWRRISKLVKIYGMPQVTCVLRTHDGNVLNNQDPAKIIHSLNYYSNKIFAESRRCDRPELSGHLSRTYRYYEAAFRTIPSWSLYADACGEAASRHEEASTRKMLSWWARWGLPVSPFKRSPRNFDKGTS